MGAVHRRRERNKKYLSKFVTPTHFTSSDTSGLLLWTRGAVLRSSLVKSSSKLDINNTTIYSLLFITPHNSAMILSHVTRWDILHGWNFPKYNVTGL